MQHATLIRKGQSGRTGKEVGRKKCASSTYPPKLVARDVSNARGETEEERSGAQELLLDLYRPTWELRMRSRRKKEPELKNSPWICSAPHGDPEGGVGGSKSQGLRNPFEFVARHMVTPRVESEEEKARAQ